MTLPTSDNLSEKEESMECRKCNDNLLSVLRYPSSKQRALLHTMRVQDKRRVENKHDISLSMNKLNLDDSDLIVKRNEPGLQFVILKQNYSSEKKTAAWLLFRLRILKVV